MLMMPQEAELRAKIGRDSHKRHRGETVYGSGRIAISADTVVNYEMSTLIYSHFATTVRGQSIRQWDRQ